MKNKLISIVVTCIFLCMSLISVGAMAPTPRLDLNDYELTVSDTSNVYVSGTVNLARGQNIALFDSTGRLPLNYISLINCLVYY